MADAFDFSPEDPAAQRSTNAAEFTVSELSQAVKRTVEDGFGRVRVRGEISGFRGRHGSGHAYFQLKDESAVIDAVVWRGSYAKLSTPPEEGMEVIATGRLTTYPRSSKYQVVVEQLEPAGLGALMKLVEERRKKLAAEGLFDEARKRPLPQCPRVIGVVTSPTGAVIRDILHRVTERWPVHVVVWPVRVQGETSGAEVARAVAGFAGDYGGPRPDVLIVARGGGSVEDLWGYNDEAVVRAVAGSPIPVVSAVGHETDWTLVDHAADVRAPTPTGAAEMVVPVRADCMASLETVARRLDVALAQGLKHRRETLRGMARGLPAGAVLLGAARQRLDLAGDKLVSALVMGTERARRRFDVATARLTPATARRLVETARDRLALATRQLARGVDATMAGARRDAAAAGRRLSPRLLSRPVDEARVALAQLGRRHARAFDANRQAAEARLAHAGQLLRAFSYQGVLERGFALVRGEGGEPVRRKAEVAAGAALTIEFADGRVAVSEGRGPDGGRAATEAAPQPKKRSKSPRRAKTPDGQGVLF